MTGDEITCENCGEIVERRDGTWMHVMPAGAAYPLLTSRCWPGKDFLAIPEFPSTED